MAVHTTRKRRNERGASLVEYTVLVALIAIAVIGVVRGFGVMVGQSVQDSSQTFQEATGGVEDPPLGG